jgi:hypothetical protein
VTFTPEQKAANEQLEDAIKEVVKAYDMMGEGRVITDYMVIGETIGFHDDEDTSSGVFLAFRGGRIRNSVALGLFDLGYDHYKATMEPVDDED